jgi:hypothetical protein
MNQKFALNCSLYFLVLILASSCTRSGVVGFSPDNRSVAVISNSGALITTNLDGTTQTMIEPEGIHPGFNISFNASGDKILYVTQNNLCVVNIDGSQLLCPWLPLPDGIQAGFVSFLPDENFIVGFVSEEQGALRIYSSDGEPVVEGNQDEIDAIFPTANAFRVKRGSGGTQWYPTLFLATEGNPIRWAILQHGALRLYSLSTSLTGPMPPITLHPDTINLLETREKSDITSGLLSPDGDQLLFRYREGDNLYGLALVNLFDPQNQPILLVNRANFRPGFAYSPTGDQIVYESNADGRSIWIVDASGINPRKMADQASLPDWH